MHVELRTLRQLASSRQDHEEVLLVGLEVVLQVIIGSALASPVTDHSCRALDDLPALPSWSILQSPAHSPSFMLESTLIRGIPCSWQRAVTSFLYMGSSQFSARMQSRACLLSRALAASLSPLARPSAIKACLSTSWIASLMPMGPVASTGAAH